MQVTSSLGITRRRTLCGGASIALMGLFSPARAESALRFGVVVPHLDSEFYRRLLNGMREAAPALQVNLDIVESGFEVARALAQIEGFVAAKVDGVIIASAGDAVGAIAVSKAHAAGVRVAAVDTPIAGADVTVIVDPKTVGVSQSEIARTLAQRAGKKTATFLYVFDPSKAIDSQRAAAFREASVRSGFAVVVAEIAVLDPKAAEDAIAQALVAHSDVTIVAAARETLAQRAVAAAAVAGRGIAVIGANGSEKEMREAGLAATIDQRPETQGAAVVGDLTSLARKTVCSNGQNPPCPTHTIEPQPIFATNK